MSQNDKYVTFISYSICDEVNWDKDKIATIAKDLINILYNWEDEEENEEQNYFVITTVVTQEGDTIIYKDSFDEMTKEEISNLLQTKYALHGRKITNIKFYRYEGKYEGDE